MKRLPLEHGMETADEPAADVLHGWLIPDGHSSDELGAVVKLCKTFLSAY